MYDASVLVDGLVALVRADAGTVDDAITDTMRRAAEELGARRCLAFRYLQSQAEAQFEWANDGAPSLLGALYRDAEMPDAMKMFARHEPVVLCDGDGRPGYVGLRMLMREQRFCGCIFVPVYERSNLRWVVGFIWRGVTPSITEVEVAFASRAASVIGAGFTRRDELAAHEDAMQQMASKQKLETLGTLAGGIVHDFNNLLQIVLGLSEVLKLELGDGESTTLVREIIEAVHRGTEMTRGFLIFSRQDVRKRQIVELQSALERVVGLLRRSIPEDRVIRTDLRCADARVFMPAADLEQAVINLCSNASAAMAEGGTLTVGSQMLDGYVEIWVEDDGEGMSPETLARACEPFFTTKAPGEGTGLGLAIIKRMVESQGGKMELHSVLGEGTRVSLRLPLSTRESTHAEVLVEAPHGKGECILVVEDEPMVRRVTASHLERAGYDVVRAANGHEALALCAKYRVALVVTDVVMPGMGGVELYRTIEAKGSAPAFLFTTAYDAGALTEQLLESPTFDLLQKPYESHALLRKVRELIDASARAHAR